MYIDTVSLHLSFMLNGCTSQSVSRPCRQLIKQMAVLLQQIDEILAGTLTQEDEDSVLAELQALTQVGAPRLVFHLYHSLISLLVV